MTRCTWYVPLNITRRVRVNVICQLLSNGWTHPDPRHATKELIFPLLACLLTMLLVPAAAVYALRELLHVPLGMKFLCKPSFRRMLVPAF